MTPKIQVYPDLSALTTAAFELVTERIRTAIAERQSCSIVLAGGTTPQPLYAALAQENLPWHQIQIFWNDERYVPQTHPDNNYGNVKQVLLDLLPIPAANIHPIPIDLTPPAVVATTYEQEIRQSFGIEPGTFPTFDLMLLGLGDDGHTAALFPHTAALSVSDRLVTVSEKDGQPRLTLTIPAINLARSKIFMVAGAAKKTALSHILAPTGDSQLYPARSIEGKGELIWLVDAAAAGKTV